MSRHLVNAGHELSIHDLREETAAPLLKEGTTWASNAAQAARDSKIVFTSLLMPESVKDVILGRGGVVEGASPGAVVVDTSTNAFDLVLELSQALGKRKIHFMDAPVSGGIEGAETRDLCIMASGDKGIYERVRPVLDLMGDKVLYCGPVGHGTVCKLCHQMFGSGMAQVAGEVLSAGVKAGVDFATLVEAMSKGAVGRNLPLQGWRQRMQETARTGPPSVPLKLMVKDVRLACDLGRRFLVPMEIANIVEQRYLDALGRGWGELDARVVLQLQEDKAGVQLRSDAQRHID